MKTTGEKIKYYRNLRDMTQEELGEKVGVQKAAINKYETGRITNIGILTLQKIADALDVPVSKLYGSSESYTCYSPPDSETNIIYKTVHTSNISERLKEALEEQNITLSELAERSGIYKGTLSHYVAGDYEPKTAYLQKLADALDVSKKWLLGYDTQKCDLNEIEFWDKYEKLNPTQRQYILKMMKALKEMERGRA